MKNVFTVGIVAVFSVLVACSGAGSGSGSPQNVPTTTVSGMLMDAPLSNATVTVYSYANGSPGAVLGTGISDNNGNYSVSIQTETAPILIAATGGYYTEEASNTTVNLSSGQSLQAVFIHTTGNSDKVYLTPFTHLAAGLAVFKIKQGNSVTSAVEASNSEISNMVGFNVLSTQPLDITNINNATANPTAGHFYGFLNAAISSWTLYASQKSGGTPHLLQNTIALAQLMYADVAADGVLDGYGIDTTGNISPLSLGVLPLSQTVYRYGIASHVISAVNSNYNKTALTQNQIATYATVYASNGDLIWAGVSPLSFGNLGRPVITFTAPSNGGWIGATSTISGSVSDNVAIDHTHLLVDSGDLGAAANPNQPTYSVSTVGSYSDGSHSLTLKSVNGLGISASLTYQVGIDNTPPTSTGSENSYFSGVNRISWTVSAQDAGSGVVAVWATNPGTGLSASLVKQANGTWYIDVPLFATFGTSPSINVYTYPVTIKDATGNCSNYDDSAGGIAGNGWRFLSSGRC